MEMSLILRLCQKIAQNIKSAFRHCFKLFYIKKLLTQDIYCPFDSIFYNSNIPLNLLT